MEIKKEAGIAYTLKCIHGVNPGTKDGLAELHMLRTMLQNELKRIGINADLEDSNPVDIHRLVGVFIRALVDPIKHPVIDQTGTTLKFSGNGFEFGQPEISGLLPILYLATRISNIKSIKLCEWCGRLFFPKSNKAKFCSRQCRNRNTYSRRNQNK